MKTPEQWNWEHTQICANDLAVHGQLLPTPQMVKFITRVQTDALLHAAEICHNLGHGKLHLENQYSCEEAIRAAAMPNK
jgi:hypothetical protein